MVTNGGPFCTADDANVFNRENGEEEILVGPVIPILIHDAESHRTQWGRG